jgi:hypothetical protein
MKDDILRKLRIRYSRTPYYTDCFKVVNNALNINSDLISDIAFQSVLVVCHYVGLNRGFGKSLSNKDLKVPDKIKDICKRENADTYVNLPGGVEIYRKEQFPSHGITLKFVEPELRQYKQFKEPFVPGLSILDVMMFNPPETVLEMISSYKLT